MSKDVASAASGKMYEGCEGDMEIAKVCSNAAYDYFESRDPKHFDEVKTVAKMVKERYPLERDDDIENTSQMLMYMQMLINLSFLLIDQPGIRTVLEEVAALDPNRPHGKVPSLYEPSSKQVGDVLAQKVFEENPDFYSQIVSSPNFARLSFVRKMGGARYIALSSLDLAYENVWTNWSGAPAPKREIQ